MDNNLLGEIEIGRNYQSNLRESLREWIPILSNFPSRKEIEDPANQLIGNSYKAFLFDSVERKIVQSVPNDLKEIINKTTEKLKLGIMPFAEEVKILAHYNNREYILNPSSRELEKYVVALKINRVFVL
ncbi:hypothetical protein J4408_01840 [Candidatus Pacearchaeota archaeon]|nr:hypothetical protein [Candidatus Pacearchaeota archaeon]